MNEISKKTREFNDFRFAGLDWSQISNKYLSMNRVGEDRIVVKVDGNHLIKTKFGWALVLDITHVVFLKDWQVSCNYYGNEVLIVEKYFTVKEWGCHEEFGESEENLDYNTWKKAAEEQDALVDEEGSKLNAVRWEI